MSKPVVHSLAPDFTGSVMGAGYDLGSQITLSGLRGKPVVLYFYPRDETPGCTEQACAIRDSWKEFSDQAHVIGVSVDSLKSHDKFIRKHGLPFPIVSDEEKSIVNDYGVWVEKSLYGRKYMGTERSTFIIDASGRIQAILERVKPHAHAALVLEALG